MLLSEIIYWVMLIVNSKINDRLTIGEKDSKNQNIIDIHSKSLYNHQIHIQ